MDIRPLDLHAMGTLNYDITAYQPILFRAESLEHLEDVVGGFFATVDDDLAARLRAEAPAVRLTTRRRRAPDDDVRGPSSCGRGCEASVALREQTHEGARRGELACGQGLDDRHHGHRQRGEVGEVAAGVHARDARAAELVDAHAARGVELEAELLGERRGLDEPRRDEQRRDPLLPAVARW